MSDRDEPQWVKRLADLRDLSSDELIAQHDWIANERAIADVNYYLDELGRREASSREKMMLRLTWAILALTIVNVVAVALSLLAR